MPRTVSSQRTGLVTWRTRSRAARPRPTPACLDAGPHRHARRRERHPFEVPCQPRGRRRHERAVERRAHREALRAEPARGRERDQPLDGARMPGDDDLPRAVQVGRRQHLSLAHPSQSRSTSALGAHDRRHPPSPAGTASCMRRPRRARRPRRPPARARRRRRAPTTRRGCARDGDGRSPAVSSRTRNAATLAARMAGCACSVMTSTSSGPSKQRRESARPRRSSASSNTRRATGNESARSRPIPTLCEPWPGRRQTATGAGISTLGRLDDLAPAIRAAVGARAVTLRRLAALRAGDDVRGGERVVRAALVAFARRGAALGNGHDGLLFRRLSRAARQGAQRRKPRIGGRRRQPHGPAFRSAPQRDRVHGSLRCRVEWWAGPGWPRSWTRGARSISSPS